MLRPKNTKYQKQQKGRNFRKKLKTNNLYSYNNLTKNVLILKAMDTGTIKEQQIIACKQTITKIIKKYGQLQIKVLACTPVSKKPKEIRMGKGKGSVEYWVNKVKRGKILFKITTSYKNLGLKALRLIKNKLSIKTKIIC